jgi:transposase
MIGLTNHHQYYLHRGPTDFRKGFDGLCGLVRQELGRNPADGAVYLFINRRRDRMKMLVWEPDGFMMYYKRLERGTFELPPTSHAAQSMSIDWRTLVLMLEGVSLQKVHYRRRYKRA